MRSALTNDKSAFALQDRMVAERSYTDYGAWIGKLIAVVDEHQGTAVTAQESPAFITGRTDIFHQVSVGAGYVGLALGFVTTVIAIHSVIA